MATNPWALRAAMAGALGLPLFALAGWVARLRRGRVIQASRARPGRDVVRPEPEVEPLERVASIIVADQTEEWIDAALRALNAALGQAGFERSPELRCMRGGEMGLEVLLGEPAPTAPPGWEVADSGYVWRLAADVSLDELRRRGHDYAALSPALVSLGASPEGPILGDLEGFGVLSVQGDPERARTFVAGAALELAVASWAQGVELRVYGMDGFEGLAGVTAVDGAELVREARGMTELLAPGPSRAGSMLGARVASGEGGEPWYPMVVLVGPHADAEVIEELVGVATTGGGVAVAGMLGGVEAHWQLIVGPDGAAVLKPLDMGMRMAGVVESSAHGGDEAPAAEPALDHSGLQETALEEPAPSKFTLDAAAVAAEAALDEAVGDQARPPADTSALPPPPPLPEPASLAGPVDHLGLVGGVGDGRTQAPLDDGLILDEGGLDHAAIGVGVGGMVAVGEEDDVAAPIPLVGPPHSRRSRLRRRHDCEVWVSILRPAPEVTGWVSESRGRRRLVEVLVYLAVYAAEHPVSGGDVRMDCFPPKLSSPEPGRPPRLKEVSADSVHQAMSRLRKQLGQGSDGWHIPPAVDGAYGIGPAVGCDWILFQALASVGARAVARHQPARAVAAWREALELVQGQPFSEVPGESFPWRDAKHLLTDIRLAVAKVADDLAALTRETEPATALWASEQGRLLLPTQLGLFDQAMAACAELGDVDGIQRAYVGKCWAHEQLDPDGGVPPETTELYRHLVARAKEAIGVRA